MGQNQTGFVKQIWIDSNCSEVMVSEICKLKSLQELRITHCNYVTGEQLLKIQANGLQRIDFEGSPQIEFPEIFHCVRVNRQTLRKLQIDGENLKNHELVELLDQVVFLDEFSIQFGESLEDLFLIKLQEKVDAQNLQKLCIRKSREITSLQFEQFFQTKFPNLQDLNLAECAFFQSSALILIANNCPNIIKINISWCFPIEDSAVIDLILKCKKIKKMKFVGLKKLTDECLLKPLEICKQQQISSAFDSLRLIDFTMSDYMNDQAMALVKKIYPNIRLINYYKEEINI